MHRASRAPWGIAIALLVSACESKPSAPADALSATPPPQAPVPSAASAPEPSSPPSAVAAPAPLPVAPPREPPKEAVTTKSGLVTLVLAPGTGKKHPKPTDVVKAKFMGWTASGQAFGTAEPSLLNMAQQPPGWSEALTLMVEGEKRRLWMSAPLAYGNAPGSPTEGLILDLELLGIPVPPPAPPDVKAPPKDATKLPSGLAYKVLTHGNGDKHPTSTSRVTMHYTGWTKAGKMFDSSVMRGAPLLIGLNQVIPGWTEGVPMMVVGDKMRLWIPAAMAYGVKPASPSNPAGDLVFDLELLAIQ